MNTIDEHSENTARAITFVRDLQDRYSTYHAHKESMAFTGLTLFTGAAGAVLVAKQWPPTAWGNSHTQMWAFLAVTALWIGVLAYLRFQLRRRRWAALRVAGCEHVLAEWITSPPSPEQLSPKGRGHIEIPCSTKFKDLFYPQKETVLVIKPITENNPPIYPAALVDVWLSQEKLGTDALKHEQLIILAGWAVYFVLAFYSLRTLLIC